MFREHERNRRHHTPFEIFKRSISDFYTYTGNDTNFKAQYSFSEFANLFYDAVCYDEKLPEDVQEKFISYIKSYINENVDKELIRSALNEIRACIMQERLDNAVKDFWVKDNERKTKKVRELLFNYSHCCKVVPAVRPLITWAENHNRMTYEFIYKIFEYGYITGKRDERAKKKTI